ncbi:MAG TPA: sugar phosphate nucleotidyltransferase, partial [Chthoniobacteraceae bacterium]|nr:sugar phosphate nucleotidyltransferase [Chthoniobacteraceae bacterium]
MSSKIYALILAGGSGERFWPLSRKSRPKQLLALFSEKTLLEDTIHRLKGLVEPSHILILTNKDQEAAVRAMAKELPEENIVAEPAKRDTAAAIALGVGWVAMRDPGATMIVLPADHLIQDVAGFQKTLRTAAAAARQSGELVTIGIKPTWACPGFGYIEQGGKASLKGVEDAAEVRQVARFREKPDPALAESFLKQGNFLWNAGMFIWTIPSILSAFSRHTPELAKFIEQLHEGRDLAHSLKEHFPHLPKISIDYAVMEKAKALVVDAAFDWDDVGSWTAAAKYWKHDPEKNICNTPLTTVDSSNNIVYTDQKTHIALMGVKNLIVVQTGDSILVADLHEAEK